MSQATSNAIFALSSDQVKKAIEFNQQLGLKPDSIRIIQHVLCVDLTGTFDEATVHALNQRDYNEVFIKNYLQRKGQSAPTTWESVVSLVKSNVGLLAELAGELGKLNDEVLWWVMNSLKDLGAHNVIISVVADYAGEDLGKAWFSRYKPDLDYAYLTQVAGEKLVVTPDQDSRRTNGVARISQPAPHNLLMTYFGPKAFTSLDSLRTAIKHALAVGVNVSPASVSGPAASEAALSKNSIFFADPRYVKALQLTVGAPVSGKMDDLTVRFIAQFQSKNGLGVDGIVGKGETLPRMIRHLQELGLQETALLLVMGYFNMWVDEDTRIYYYPNEKQGKVAINRNIEGVPIIAIGEKAFSNSLNSHDIDTYARILYAAASPLAEYAESQFIGKKIIVHRSFFSLLDQVNVYAKKYNLFLSINSSFRSDDQEISGAVVKPADRSNHKAGFAIDYNFVLGDTKRSIHSSELKGSESAWPASVRNFLTDIRADKALRWGGDFNTPDVVHIDIRVNSDEIGYSALRYAAQTAYQLYISKGTRAIDYNTSEPTCDH